jgi:nitrate/nitrite transporter NarK
LWLLALGAFFAVNASASLGAFYVESTVASGVAPGVAGIFLSVGSAVGILIRIAWGFVADRRPPLHFVMLTSMLVAGAVSFWMLGFRWSSTALFPVTILVFGTGWAWPSLLNFAVVRRVPQAPGVASGIIGAGQYGGGILGPLVFGVLVEDVSYRAAWSFAGVMVAVAAAFVTLGGRSLERAVSERSSA